MPSPLFYRGRLYFVRNGGMVTSYMPDSGKVVLDRHIPIGAFMILFFAYFWLGFEHREACKAQVNQAGCAKWAATWNPPAPQ